MPHKNHTLAALLGATLLAGAAAAGDDLSYSYLEARYAEAELDDDAFNIDGDGFVLNGSLEFSETVHLFIGYDKLEFDDNVDVKTRLIGGGVAIPLSPQADVVLRAGFAEARFSTPFFEDEDDGHFASLGFRALVTPDIELYGDFRSLRLDDAGDEESTTLGLDFYANDGLAVGPAVTWVDDTTIWSLGAKFYF